MSNTGSAQSQWKEIANTLGFPDEPQMWNQLYIIEGRSIAELAKTIGYGSATVARRIDLCGVEKRTRGGQNNPSKLIIALNHLDQRYLRLANPEEVSLLIGSSVHSIYRLMKEL